MWTDSEGEAKRLLFFSKYIFYLMFDYFLSFSSWASVFCVPLCLRFLVPFRFMGLNLGIFQFLVFSY